MFNIGGNKARLVAAMHYNRRRVYIRAILTHAEYDADSFPSVGPKCANLVLCTGRAPKRSTCPVLDMCLQVGVEEHR